MASSQILLGGSNYSALLLAFSDTKGAQHQSVEGDHGRIETRITMVFHDVG